MSPNPPGPRTPDARTADVPTPGAPDPKRWWVLGAVCLSVLLVLTDVTIVNVALPTLSRDLGASTSDLQWVVDAYTLVFSGLLLVAGYLGDRVGRRRALQAGLVAFAATSLAAALAQTTGQLVAARAAMGIGAALIYPATLAIITATFTEARERALAIGLWAATSGVAVAIGPVAGGALLGHFAWGAVFLVNLPLAALAFGANAWLVPDSRDPASGRFDGAGALGSVAAVGTLVWTLIEAPDRGWTSGATVAGAVAAAALLAAFIAREARTPHPLLDVRLFANARFSAGAAAISLALFGLFGFIFMITQYFQAVRGYDAMGAGLHTLPFAVVMAVFSPLAIVAAGRLGTTLVVAGGLVLMAAGFGVAASSTLSSDYWGRVIVSMTLIAAGLAFASGPATEAVMGALPAAKAGAGAAVNDTTREVGGTLGVAVVGSVMASLYAPRVADSLAALGFGPDAQDAARESVIAGLGVASAAPGEVAGAALTAVRGAFMDGLVAGSLVAALACLLAAMGVLAFLPARQRAAAPRRQVPAAGQSAVLVGEPALQGR